MSDYGLPALFCLFAWWFSTGLILYLVGLPWRTFRWTVLGATFLLGVGFAALVWSRAETGPLAAYVAFLGALLVWGWNETVFLMGWVTGPRRTACPPGCRGWRHFLHGVEAILYHELALLASLGLVVACTWDSVNQFGTWTFAILWFMRLSAKLNVFLGVPNLSEDFLAPHLDYLKSFFRRRSMNALFPFSVLISTLAAVLLVQEAIAAPAGSMAVIGFTLLATLMILAVAEHWFLVLPLPIAAVWSWGFRSRSLSDNFDIELARKPVSVESAPINQPTTHRLYR